MLAHLGQFLGRQRSRLVQHLIADADLADVVKRRQRGQQIDALARQVGAELGVGRQLLREQPRVALGPQRVAAGLGVAHLGQRQQRLR